MENAETLRDKRAGIDFWRKAKIDRNLCGDDHLKSLVNFCKKNKKVICYGASDHGHAVKHLLEAHGINVFAFMISGNIEGHECRDGIPIYSISDIDKLGTNIGIVLSLYQRYHEEICAELKKKGINEIFPISDIELRLIEKETAFIECQTYLYSSLECSQLEIDKYKEKARQIFSKYNRVECRFSDMRSIGAYAYWQYYFYSYKLVSSDVFFLYYPKVFENHPEQMLKGPNEYLLGKLKTDGMEFLTFSNLDFWKYVFQNYTDQVYIKNDFVSSNWTNDLLRLFYEIPLNNPVVYLTKIEQKNGNEFLKKVGIEGQYVCISNRDHVFLQKVRGEKQKQIRDPFFNSDIEMQIGGVKYLEALDIKTVRMGSAIEKTFDYPNVIEYAGLYRNEFLDVFLTANCKFFVADVSGILAFPILLAKPMVVLNAPLLSVRQDGALFFSPQKDIALLKKLWDKNEGRYLTIREMLDFEVNICNSGDNLQGAVFTEYNRRGIVPVDNTKDEILAAFEEMNRRIDGTIVYDEIDITLQNQYRLIVDSYPMKENLLFQWRLCAQFLRANQWLLK